MRKIFVLIIIGALSVCLAGCSGTAPAGSPEKSSLPDVIQNDSKTVTLSKVSDKLWVHTTYQNGVHTPSNGMLAVSSKGIILVDTPWTKEQTKDLLDLIKENFKKDCVLAVITHAHDDRIGGIDILLENNIKTISTSLTGAMAEKQRYKAPKPEIPMDKSIILDYGDIRAEAGYFGEGHTCDNIVVWFPEEKVLFGGCLVKAKDAADMGSISEANLEQWPLTLKRVSERYGDARLIVPGHGAWGGKELIEHTQELLKSAHKN